MFLGIGWNISNSGLGFVAVSSLKPPAGYAFVIQGGRVVTQDGKPVVRKVE